TIIAPPGTYGSAASVTVVIDTGGAAATGTVQLSVDGGSPLSGTLSNSSYTFNVGLQTVGDHTLTANYLGGGGLPPSSGTGTLTVTADALTKVYGAALPNLTFTASGFVNGDTMATAFSGSLATTATASSPVAAGGYPITQGTLAAANYTITFTGANLTITAVP